jgi:hypothetical protein
MCDLTAILTPTSHPAAVDAVATGLDDGGPVQVTADQCKTLGLGDSVDRDQRSALQCSSGAVHERFERRR